MMRNGMQGVSLASMSPSINLRTVAPPGSAPFGSAPCGNASSSCAPCGSASSFVIAFNLPAPSTASSSRLLPDLL
eukprot:CAMPEP_0202382302 /NCGR_PEP_ID=MMETSP1127-20130417/42268_1 /ASSEMBLY_ACC=CAM_ASM_000462 /TAXON_ID=3047 /ORGANISM="Dunaliella tertiolecta, Strain CCMP1320" /LENGTH=74 /DNA_ID=CAMNT_0048981471 /DNA_START=379 /DNA_END=603 /DNA_ORIENTATION=-